MRRWFLVVMVAVSVQSFVLPAGRSLAAGLGSVLTSGQMLIAGQSLTSANRQYTLAMQRDGNLVEYTAGQPVWSTGTAGNTGALVVMQGDGNVVVYASGGAPLWSSGTGSRPNAIFTLTLQSDGNLVIYGAGGAIWSNSARASRLVAGGSLSGGHFLTSPNAQYTLAVQTDGNLVEYMGGQAIWNAGAAGNPGAYTTMQTDGNLVVYSAAGAALWDAKTGGQPRGLYILVLQDDANLVIYGPNGVVWSNDAVANTLDSVGSLSVGQYLFAPNRQYVLVMQGDGNLVEYTGSQVLWSSGTSGTPGAHVVMQSDGNLVIYGPDGTVLWNSGSATQLFGHYRLTLQSDANLVIYGPIGVVWVRADSISARVQGASAYALARSGIAGFTLIDTATGAVYTGGYADTQIRTASVVKVPIAMTLMARANAQGRGLTSNEQSLLRLMITQSDNDAATALWNEVGGTDAVVGEMNALGATNTQADPSNPQAWGFTLTTSRDLAIVLAQLARGAVGADQTNTILSLMHQVIPSQRWGIGAALPGAAVKNGWYPDPGDWRVNCLGIAGGTRYALAVMTRYPIGLGQGYGEITCQEIAAQLLPDLTGSSAASPAVRSAQPPDNYVPALSGPGMTVDGG